MSETITTQSNKLEFSRDDAYKIIWEHLKYCDGYTNDNRNPAMANLESRIVWSYIFTVEKMYPKLNDYFYTPNGVNCKILNSTKYFLWVSHIVDIIREELEIKVEELQYVHELFNGNLPDQIIRIILQLIWDTESATKEPKPEKRAVANTGFDFDDLCTKEGRTIKIFGRTIEFNMQYTFNRVRNYLDKYTEFKIFDESDVLQPDIVLAICYFIGGALDNLNRIEPCLAYQEAGNIFDISALGLFKDIAREIAEKVDLKTNVNFNEVKDTTGALVTKEMLRIAMLAIVRTVSSDNTEKKLTNETKDQLYHTDLMNFATPGTEEYVMLQTYIKVLTEKLNTIKIVIHPTDDGAVILNKDVSWFNDLVDTTVEGVYGPEELEEKQKLIDIAVFIVVKRLLRPDDPGYTFKF